MMKFDLRAPLVYTYFHLEAKITDFPPKMTEKDEFLFCFELDPEQGRSIEPERGRLLGPLLFSGRKTCSCSEAGDSSALAAETLPDSPPTMLGKQVSLPRGEYLFVQRRQEGLCAANGTGGACTCREEWLDLAIEQQKDGLWEMYKPVNRLYVRCLFEDGMWVTQLFRPLPGTTE